MKNINTLYHYTSQDAFLKIMESKSLLASNILLLNDKSEIKHGIGVLEKYIENQKITKKQKDKLIIQLYKEQSIFNRFTIFTFSLSEDGDRLSQWRGYTGNKPGYAIGFNKIELEKLAYKYDFRLCKCVYCSRDDSIAIHKFVNEKEIIHRTGENIDIYLYNALIKLAEIKEKSFIEEKEWRISSDLIQNLHPSVEFFPSQNFIKSFYRIDFNDINIEKLINKVVIGPNPDPNLAKYALENYFANKTPYDIKIENSKIPFRM